MLRDAPSFPCEYRPTTNCNLNCGLWRGSHLLLTANDGYVLGRPRIDAVEVKFIVDPNTLIANVLAGTVQVTMGRGISLEQVEQVRGQWRDGSVDTAISSFVQLFPQFINPIPAIVGSPNPQFRRALMHAMNRQEMVDTIQYGAVPVAHVFVTPDGRVKILDFGLAKLIDQESTGVVSSVLPTSPPGTSPGLVLGTTGYMSPEQVRGEHVDRRTDVFALGVVLYEMLTGRRAFVRDTVPETMTAILRDDVPDLRNSNPQVSLPLEQLMRRCLDKDPARRFEAMRDLASALSTIEVTPTSSTTAVMSVREFVPPAPEKRRPALPIAAIVFVTLAFGAIVAMVNGC